MSTAHRVRAWPARMIGILCVMTVGPTTAQTVVEEIIVTSQKREQSLQDVPIAVSAYGAETLRRAGVQDIRDLQQLSPSLVLTSTQSESAGTTARLRGVGTTGDNLGLESSVAIFVDGVYRNRNSVALTDLGEIERIEVLRGPQGTLFGKNASAGLIQVITKKPNADEFGGYAEGGIGDFDQYRLAGGITGPIVEGVAGFRLDASWTERDGFIDNVSDKPGAEDEYNDRDRYLVRGQLTSEIGDAIDLRLIADYASRDETCCAAVTDVSGPTAAIINSPNPFNGGLPLGTVIAPADPFARNTTANPPPRGGYISEVDEWGLSLEVNWDVGPGTLTSVTAYRDWDSDRAQDVDYTDAEILYRIEGGYGNEFETLTQELRYAWETDNFDWMVGFYYVDEELNVLDGIRTGSVYEAYVNTLLFSFGEPLLPTGSFVDGQGALTDDFRQETDSYALFTHNTWRATDRLDVTVGLRYTDEDKDVTANLVADNPACLAFATGMLPLGPTGASLTCLPLISPLVDNALNPVLGPGVPYTGSRNDDEWTGTFVVNYDFADDWFAYVSYSRGYKAGGFNLDRAGFNNPDPVAGTLPSTTDLEFEPETVDSYEIGAKGSLWDDRVRLNAALFYAQFDDFQLNTFTGTNFIVTNLEEVESQGVEVEGTAFLFEGLTLTTGVSYTDARYDDGISNATLAGRRLTNAPYWIVTAAADYERQIFGDLLGFARLDYRFTGNVNTGSDLDPEKEQASYPVWNGSIGISAEDGFWEVELWGRNLFDKDYRQVVIDAPLQTGSFNAFLGDPRTWGLRARINF